MRSIGVHMYRSTGDITDNFTSFSDIAKSQIDNLSMSATGCFNDMDMLTVGMYGKGHVGLGRVCTYEEYRMQFALWCLFGVPLMMGCDMRTLDPACEALLKNPDLIRINQDAECRPPYVVRRGNLVGPNPNPKEGENSWVNIPDSAFTFLRHLSGNEFVLGFFNFSEVEAAVPCELADAGLPYPSGMGLSLRDVFTGEDLGVKRDFLNPVIPGHDCRLYLCRMVRCDG